MPYIALDFDTEMKAAAESSDKEKTFELPDGSASAGEVPVQVAMVMYEMTDLQYQAVYNVLSFSPASMMATTLDVISQNI